MISSILEHTTAHGAIKGKTQKSKVKYYDIDAVLSVGQTYHRYYSKDVTLLIDNNLFENHIQPVVAGNRMYKVSFSGCLR